ncbi:MFS transporter [Paenibacillus sp. Leaf72]|uniref:MFS transporter n=1 Tax=Paenibacillus sp. Leaf72 TaxID=1736234 RepID=UPI0006F31256|nr:MFS transporter [Paenibacillus sp. Leaf72]KQO18653.1 multidrug transporter [Paenibacillus sp. Leaf72]
MSLLLRNRGAILLLMGNILLVFTGIGLVIPVMPAYMRELDLNGSILGFMVAAFSLAQLLFSPLAGRLSDSFGRKKMIVAGVTLFALSEWMFGAVSEPWLLFVSRILGGVGAAFSMPSIMAYVADVTSNEERAKGMGYINAAITTGFIIGPGIGGYLAEFGVRVPFYVAGIAGGVAAIVTLLVLPESKAKAAPTAAALAPSKAKASASASAGEPSFMSQLLTSYKQPYFFSLIIVLVASFGLANYETVFGLYVDHRFGFTATDIAFIITFGSIAGAVVQVTIFGWILNRFGEQNVITWSLFIAGLFVLLMLLTNNYWMVFVVTFFLFLSVDILRPAIGTQISKMANDQQGYLAGLNSAFTSLGNILGPITAGVLFDMNINFPYASAGIVLLLCFLLSMRAGKKKAVPARG